MLQLRKGIDTHTETKEAPKPQRKPRIRIISNVQIAPPRTEKEEKREINIFESNLHKDEWKTVTGKKKKKIKTVNGKKYTNRDRREQAAKGKTPSTNNRIRKPPPPYWSCSP